MLGFYLGTHQPHWLRTTQVPLFISDRRLRDYRTLPRAAGTWALDSGGFTELSAHGSWEHGPTPEQYIARIRRYYDEIGGLEWVAPQDWMCEPWILAKTGLDVAGHQRQTVDNYLRLRDLARNADLPDGLVVPVLQGWESDDYLRCVERYQRSDVDLSAVSRVGLGTVCRRQATAAVGEILADLHAAGVTRLHGFGFKIQGLQQYAGWLASADSMAWSYAARRRPAMSGCVRHRNCANCPRFAYHWRATHVEPLLDRRMTTWVQPRLFGAWHAA